MPTIKLPTWSIVLDALRKVAPMAVVLSERGVGLRVDQLGQKLDFTQNLTSWTLRILSGMSEGVCEWMV